MVLLLDAAVDNGLLDALPGSAASLAADLGLAPHAVRVVLDGLALWGIVAVDDDGGYSLARPHRGPTPPPCCATMPGPSGGGAPSPIGSGGNHPTPAA